MPEEFVPVKPNRWPFYPGVTYGMRFILRFVGGVRVTGREHLPTTGGALVCANHISYVDPPAVGAAIPRLTYYFTKQELFRIPVLGWLLAHSNAVPVQRAGLDRAALRMAERVLRSGYLLVVFPEGARSPDGTMQRGQAGAAYLAARTGAAMIPTSVCGTDQVLPRGARWLRRGTVQVAFGEPMLVPREASKGELQAITDQMMAEIARLHAQQLAWVAARRGRA